MNKPWLIIACDNYYPNGELDNIRGAFKTEEEALEEYYLIKRKWDNSEVVNIVDYIKERFGE